MTTSHGNQLPKRSKVRLGDIAHVIAGYAFPSKTMTTDSGQYQLVKIGNLYQGRLDLSRNPSFINEIENRHRKFLLQRGDILITLTGTLGKRDFGYTTLVESESNLLLNQRVCAIRPMPALANSDYLISVLRASDFLDSFFDLSIGGTGNQANVSSNDLKELLLSLPEANEQNAVASLSNTWQRAAEKSEQLIVAKERHYSALVQALIVVRSKQKSWQQVAIRDISERIQRQGDGRDYPLLTISSASGFIRQDERYGRYMAGESAKTYTLLRGGEFSYNKGNSKRYEFGCVFQLHNYEAALVPSVYVSFRLDDSVCAAYMRHLFVADYLKPQLRALVKTGVRNNGLLNISPDEFLSTRVPLPPLDQQTQIANVLDAASEDVDLMRRHLAALRVQKRGLMQKLLTGQWRLPGQGEAS